MQSSRKHMVLVFLYIQNNKQFIGLKNHMHNKIITTNFFLNYNHNFKFLEFFIVHIIFNKIECITYEG